MLVYGDPKFSVLLDALFENCRSRIRRLNLASLDELRSLLIFAGQIEQAVADRDMKSATDQELANASAQLTDCAARLFCSKFLSRENSNDKRILTDAMERIRQIRSSAPALGKELVTVKVPEGCAFYALFPEQYCMTAANWVRQHSDRAEALVVGIRSIGTSLSAVVKETLCQAGCKALRLTVRPGGHPFQRRLTLDASKFASDVPVLIVDEGPGISGSSMASVAEAFISIGCRHVAFLPGHGNEPGNAASENVREIWRSTPRFVTPLEDIDWNGSSLEQSLQVRAEEIKGIKRSFERVENISAGLWQNLLPKDKIEWPASPPQFERLKYLCAARQGGSVIWKFAGLHGGLDGTDACETALARLLQLASAGYCPAPLDSFRGFVALPWVEGARLTWANAKDTSVLNWIGNYIVDAARPGLSASQNKIAIQRAAHMLHSNVKESLGESFLAKALALTDAAFEADVPLSYGDGHLAPHEWTRTADGKLFKLDAEGHAADHTLIGQQSLLWDIAGACVEWRLDTRSAAPLFEAIEARGIRADLEALRFYRAAYSAFRVGLFSLGLTQVSDEQQRIQLGRGRAFYLKHLTGILNAEAAIAQSAY